MVGARVRSPHNTYLAILVEEGIIGLLLYLGLFLALFTRLRTLPSFERRIGLTLLATLAVAILPLGWDVYKASWVLLGLIASWAAIFSRQTPVVYPQARPPFRRPGRAPAPAGIK
jgi:O-antigen ligase